MKGAKRVNQTADFSLGERNFVNPALYRLTKARRFRSFLASERIEKE